jgi:predicted  nucleic acid-binding Zn-ribbon protein
MQKLVDKAKENYDFEIKTRGAMEMEIKNQKNKLFGIKENFIMLESKAKKLHNKVKGFEIETDKLNMQIKILQDQQQKYGIEASSAHARYYQTVEELKIKNNIIAELQKKNLELESKLKHQMNLYEAVRSDRNLYSKNLIEAHKEIGQLTKKWTRMTHQIGQLREEIKTKSKIENKGEF